MSLSLIARIRSSLCHVSSHGHRERSNTCRCHQIYCLLTPFTAGLRQNTVFSFTLASPLLFSLTHPARAGQQLKWTCDRTSEPRSFNCVPSIDITTTVIAKGMLAVHRRPAYVHIEPNGLHSSGTELLSLGLFVFSSSVGVCPQRFIVRRCEYCAE
jgi:hypothetical protein